MPIKTKTALCKLCSAPMPMLAPTHPFGTELCYSCSELEHRIERDITLTIKILNKLGYAVVKTKEKEKTK